jgi:hypothetical protein
MAFGEGAVCSRVFLEGPRKPFLAASKGPSCLARQHPIFESDSGALLCGVEIRAQVDQLLSAGDASPRQVKRQRPAWDDDADEWDDDSDDAPSD